MLFLIPALSLAGIPPLSGFFAKLSLVQAGLRAEQYLIVATALVVGLLTLFSMMKIWGEVFWKPSVEHHAGGPVKPLLAPVIMLAAVTIAISLAAGPVFVLATQAAEQLLNRQDYIHAVLGELP
jgi:multicomponent Na+:H+ antiporter subunit D